MAFLEPQLDATRSSAQARVGALKVLVITGTDHHPFDRLVEWMSAWHDARNLDGPRVEMLVQTGASTVDCSGSTQDLLTRAELDHYAAGADVVVCHGGPGAVHDARSAGIRPIVVPRDPVLGEHVDEHQQRFARFLHGKGAIDCVENRDVLFQILDLAIDDRESQLLGDADPSLSGGQRGESVRRFARHVELLLGRGRRPGRRILSRRFRAEDPSAPKVLFVSSSGGHLAQLWRLMPWADDLDRTWVTFDTVDATSLLADEPVEIAYSPTTRNIKNLLRNTIMAIGVLRRHRPDLIVSTGAAVAVPYFFLSRIAGVPTAYVEVFDRVDMATLTGRLVERVTDLFCLQWPEQETLYDNGVVIGPLL